MRLIQYRLYLLDKDDDADDAKRYEKCSDTFISMLRVNDTFALESENSEIGDIYYKVIDRTWYEVDNDIFCEITAKGE